LRPPEKIISMPPRSVYNVVALMRRRLAHAAFVAVLAVVQLIPVHAEELVISNTDVSVQVSGPWQHATAPAQGGGSDYLFRPPSTGGATVFWPFPTSLGAGQFEVFANWVSGPDRATNATYWVASDGGTQAVTQNQQANGGAWQSLGHVFIRTG
jgi:hypothetical protein